MMISAKIESIETYQETPIATDVIELKARWYRLLAQHCFDKGQAKVVSVAREKELLATLPFADVIERYKIDIRKRFSLGHFYTSVNTPLMLSGEVDEACQRLLCEISKGKDWDLIELGPMNEGAAEFQSLCAACDRLKLWYLPKFRFKNWHLFISGLDFKNYFSGRPGALRNTVDRKKKKLSREHQWHIEVYREQAQLAEALNHYESVYGDSWKSAEGYPDFVRELCRWAADEGWLRLGILYIENRPVAAQIWFVLNQQAAIFKLAYDEAYGQYSVGSILTEHMMALAIDNDGVTFVDFLKGDERYKQDWMSHSQNRSSLLIFNKRTLRGWLMGIRYKLLPGLYKKLVKGR